MHRHTKELKFQDKYFSGLLAINFLLHYILLSQSFFISDIKIELTKICLNIKTYLFLDTFVNGEHVQRHGRKAQADEKVRVQPQHLRSQVGRVTTN